MRSKFATDVKMQSSYQRASARSTTISLFVFVSSFCGLSIPSGQVVKRNRSSLSCFSVVHACISKNLSACGCGCMHFHVCNTDLFFCS